jgi:hypothetical protein
VGAQIVRNGIGAHVRGGRRDPHDVSHACVAEGEVEGGFVGEVGGFVVRGDEGAGYVVLLEPCGGEFGLGLLDDGDEGEGGEVLGDGTGW